MHSNVSLFLSVNEKKQKKRIQLKHTVKREQKKKNTKRTTSFEWYQTLSLSILIVCVLFDLPTDPSYLLNIHLEWFFVDKRLLEIFIQHFHF